MWKSSVHLFNCSNSKKDKINLCSQMQSLKLCNTFFPTKFRKVCLNYFCKNISNSTENKETLKIAKGKLPESFLLRCDSVVLIPKNVVMICDVNWCQYCTKCEQLTKEVIWKVILQWYRNRGGQRGHWPPQYLSDQLTLFQPRRAGYPHLLLLAPNFFIFRHHCTVDRKTKQ